MGPRSLGNIHLLPDESREAAIWGVNGNAGALASQQKGKMPLAEAVIFHHNLKIEVSLGNFTFFSVARAPLHHVKLRRGSQIPSKRKEMSFSAQF